ncbi:MAG: RDD family protein [Anaerolineales bacterium]|nr:RDD family protein [Anaerolineales bacterium]MCB9172276.1 RDD family protein [Ardenticatenales bacterium]
MEQTAFESPLSASSPVVREIPVVGFGPRFAAFAIDVIILFIPLVLIVVLMETVGSALDPDQNGLYPILECLVTFGAVVFSSAYLLYFWTRPDGATLGKRLLGLRIVTMTGGPLDLATAAKRIFGHYISNAVFQLGYAWVAFDAKHRAFHDIIAGTYVIRNADAPAAGEQVTFVAEQDHGRLLVLLYYFSVTVLPCLLIFAFLFLFADRAG